jgi:hypothetical protein
MSDQGEVTGTIARRPRKKAKGGPTVKKGGKKVQMTFLLESKARPRVRGGRKARTWDDDWPEFLERLKALLKRFKVTIKKLKQRSG